MDTDFLVDPRSTSIHKSSNGCWTCRLRRKKCDEHHPVCDTCDALNITCYYDQEKPDWMDGGVRQEEMAEKLKREVKERGHRRLGSRATHISSDGAAFGRATTSARTVLPQTVSTQPMSDAFELSPLSHSGGIEPCPKAFDVTTPRRAVCQFATSGARDGVAFGSSDAILIMFYIEHVLPFLFPFYHPPLLQGGRAWVLEMMISSPVVRQATLCQSSYFFSLSRDTANGEVDWEIVLAQTREAFEVLRQSLQVINSSNITEHVHGAVRVMSSIMQVQRFEIAVLSFDNCQAHLNAALALFRQLLDIGDTTEPLGLGSSFRAVMNQLGPPSRIFPAQCGQVPSAEQAAFRFSSTLLIFDDIIASTVLQEQPRLYEYHRVLLEDIDGTGLSIDLEAAVGCQNWVLLHIGETSVLDAWKQRCKSSGNLDVMELVRRATLIKSCLETRLAGLEADTIPSPKESNSVFDVFAADYNQYTKTIARQKPLVTSVWAHAALIYLSVVVSGWQPASADVRYHVERIFQLLIHEISPPELLRTMVWPLCVAGCLAEPALQTQLYNMVEALQPRTVFGTLRKALEVMESVWRNVDSGDVASRDLATCFRIQGELVLLV
ncbi:fungal-specific transcription factor domain-containing protein [Xylariaceae sp. AK1471]|nr:fungal-specific transcription factor domain-containing protein [Xylariaceae sp. AK1471]